MLQYALVVMLALAGAQSEDVTLTEKETVTFVFEFNAIACIDEATARHITTIIDKSEREILERLATDRAIQKSCGLAMMPSGFSTPRELAEDGVEILQGEPRTDGRSELIYKVGREHEQNAAGLDIYIVFFPGDD